jgi:hypothetical protein
MSKQNQKPDAARQDARPKRSSEQTFNELRKDVAQRNERTHQAARKVRTAREREQLLRRRNQDY